MRIPLTLLKSAAYLLLGASAVFATTAANALTNYSFSYTNDSGNGNTLSGSFSIDEALANTDAFFESPIPSWFTNLSVTETVAGTPNVYSQSDYTTLIWIRSVSSIDFAQDLTTQLSDFNFQDSSSIGTPPYGAGPNEIFSSSSGGTSYLLASITPTASAVPGPLPILGLPAVLFYSRKLKKRIKASRELSSASLV